MRAKMRPHQGFLEGLKLPLDPATAELAQKIFERCRTAINDTMGSQPGQVCAARYSLPL